MNPNVEERFVKLIEIPIVNKAFTFAAAAHAALDQKRKYSGAPYIVHPVEVCVLVSMVEHTPEMLAGALLHDVVEDTAITLGMINDHFGGVVMNHVSWLTDISKKSDGNRAFRKALDRAHTHTAPKQSQTIKCADLIANTKDICQADTNFGVVYMKEKRLILEGMNADKTLMDYAWTLVNDWEASLK